MGWVKYNANPQRRNVGDCTVRAIAKATGKSWEEVYMGLTAEGYLRKDMPSANHVWGAYLRRNGYSRHVLPDNCPDCYTVADFAGDHTKGTYILALANHVVCVSGGDWYDTWDSGEETPIFYWEKG